MDSSEAIARLRATCAAGDDPRLDDDELLDILTSARTIDIAGNPVSNTADLVGAWAPETGVTPGAVIGLAGGRRFWRCVVGGTTGTTGPSWPNLAGQPITPVYTVLDGSVLWADNGTMWGPTWDLDLAAMLAWERKAQKVAGRFDFTTDGQTFNRRQVYGHCVTMADRYRRRLSGTIRTTG